MRGKESKEIWVCDSGGLTSQCSQALDLSRAWAQGWSKEKSDLTKLCLQNSDVQRAGLELKQG